jgi:hypothetical protein
VGIRPGLRVRGSAGKDELHHALPTAKSMADSGWTNLDDYVPPISRTFAQAHHSNRTCIQQRYRRKRRPHGLSRTGP